MRSIRPGSKSPRRRSPDPGVVLAAAFVAPRPSSSSENCSAGSSRRGVSPASCSSRQKSLRGLAKCAAAAAETRPGLMPQNTHRSPGASTSGTALAGSGLRLPGATRLTAWHALRPRGGAGPRARKRRRRAPARTCPDPPARPRTADAGHAASCSGPRASRRRSNSRRTSSPAVAGLRCVGRSTLTWSLRCAP